MLNVEDARKMLNSIPVNRDIEFEIKVLNSFIDEVERLLQYNAIKQTPALFKVIK